MVNVEITTPVQRVATVPQRPGGSPDGTARADAQQPINDAVNLSSDAKKALKEQMEGQTIAEAYLKHMLAKDPAPMDGSQQTNQDDANDERKSWQQQAKKALQLTIDDIGWLLDALGIDESHKGTVASAVQDRASIDLRSASPSVVAMVTAATPNSEAVPAIFIEDLNLSVSKNDADVSVRRVTLTTIHGSARERVTDQAQPMVIDVGGELQNVPAAAGQGPVTSSATARPRASYDASEESFRYGSMAADDQRYASAAVAEVVHGMLIVREGGKVQPDNSLKLRLDALMPLPSSKV